MFRLLQSRFWATILLLVLTPGVLLAQKKDLSLEDYAQWERIGANRLSPDGKWFAYQIVLEEGDGWLVARPVNGDAEHKFMYSSNPRFSNDNQWLAFTIGLSEDETKKKEKSKETIKTALGLMNLSTAKVDTIKAVQSATFSDDGKYLAIRKYKAEGVKTEGSDLVVRTLGTGSMQNVGNVSEYAFSPEGSLLAVAIDASEKLGNGVHLIDLKAATTRVLDSDVRKYSGLVWRKDSFDLAFLKESTRKGKDYQDHLLYAFSKLNGVSTTRTFDSAAHTGFPADFRVASEGSLSWSEDGSRLFFGLKSRIQDESDAEDKKVAADSTKKAVKTNADRDKDLDPAGVDIWHWKDPIIQPGQGVRATADRNYTYQSSWTLAKNGFAKLTDDQIKRVTLTGDQKHAVGYDTTPYEPAFRETWQDVYVMDTETGKRTKILERIEFVSTSPDGYFVLYFRGNHWWSYSVATGQHTNLTEDIDTKFNDFTSIYGREEDRAFGSAQWTDKDGTVILYDQFDAYQVKADGTGTKRLTHGAKDKVQFRQVRLDFEKETIGPNDPLFFSAYGEVTKDSGYYILRKNPRRSEDLAALEKLVYEPRMISGLRKAEKAPVFTFMTQKADESPNIFAVDESFSNSVQLTTTNKQQADYHWAHSELVDFTNSNGVALQGRLLYPANYEPGKKYPMIVYIYELRSQSLHSYSTPSRSNAYSQRRFSAEGYFVYEPDIVYRLSDPGMSAVEALVPAVQKVVDTGMIDTNRIGLTGHSWGAYQTSFVVTQTDIFSAAVAGAPLTNMISMYNSVYWNSGGGDATIFEVSQGRFPKPYWEDMEKFIQNSPVFNASKINTPLLVAFGDEDGAVDFNQGVEMYNTMRRLEKEFILLVYDGENHGLRLKQNQLDYANRTHDWFNHFLRDQAPAKWISDGIPFLEKDLEKKKAKEAREKAAKEDQ
ncbi:MAG: prolyl oligopeptidase family serine peptidase [Bacteroidetes bacterium]|nr:prolyl oligopeptidase family serine peptidase [Bacteroidota bacterium]